jgi:hypothetical protein
MKGTPCRQTIFEFKPEGDKREQFVPTISFILVLGKLKYIQSG